MQFLSVIIKRQIKRLIFLEHKGVKMKDNITIKNSDNNMILPCVAMRDLVIFPNMVMHFDVARERSVKALKKALANNEKIFLTAQKDISIAEPAYKDVFKVGSIAEIKQIVKGQDGVSRVLVEGVKKAKLLRLEKNEGGYLEAEVKKIPNYSREKFSETEIEALTREIRAMFERYVAVVPRMPKELYAAVLGSSSPKSLFETLAFNISLSLEERQALLECSTIGEKLAMILTSLTREIEILEIEKEIHLKVNDQIDRNQRDYYIREQIRVLSKEIGEDEEHESDANEYLKKIKKLNLTSENSKKLIAEVKRLSRMSSASQEAVVIRSYLDTCLELPWNKLTKDNTDIKKADKVLNRDHYGMTKVKDRILETLSVKALSPDVKGQIICLYGPPGVGKTSIGKSIANALGRKYVRVSLGGVKDESDIRGHRKTYVGAMPGRIINAMKLAGTKNPVMLLDEIDKMSNDFRGDPSSAMLEVLDAEQNKDFRDHYIEMPFDLSDVLFITTANSLDTIQPPLLDRMEVIELSSYTREEKFQIAKRHLVSKQILKNGLKRIQIRINDDAIYEIIDSYTKEAGVRKLERTIGTLCRKAAKEIVENQSKRVTFKAENLETYLGAKKYKPETFANKTEIGTVNGLAWTSVGGVIMPLEVLILDGKGKVELTGSLGDVMKESARIAVSYARSVADKYGIPSDFFEKKDIHIHAPEGAVPKDGPSAGVTLATALISAITGIPVRCDVAMTGEITLRGKVLAIGGLREKTMAAYRYGINTVIVPAENKGDMAEVEDVVKASINFVFAETISDVLNIALVKDADGKASIPVSMLTGDDKSLQIMVGN